MDKAQQVGRGQLVSVTKNAQGHVQIIIAPGTGTLSASGQSTTLYSAGRHGQSIAGVMGKPVTLFCTLSQWAEAGSAAIPGVKI